MNPHLPNYLANFPPQNPNPNPNFPFPNPHPQPPPHQSPPPTLSSTLSNLTHLLSLSNQTLKTSNSFSHQNPQNVPCPYNPNHLMPPESLFLHSLRCPSSPFFPLPSSLIQSLHYPKTLLQPRNHPFPEPDGSSDIRLSLAGYYGEFASNFSYKDCPAVVSLKELDSSRWEFSLPRVLWTECSGFDGVRVGEIERFDESQFRVLPSDLLGLMRELDGWMDFPYTYSFSAFCAVLRLNLVQGSDLRRWVIAGSPHYGVVIDRWVTDHVCLLFSLCFKAISREARGFVGRQIDAKDSRFECSVLVQVMRWIVSQLSVLYGEPCSMAFAVYIFKQCLLEAAKKAKFFPLETKEEECVSGLDTEGSSFGNVKLRETSKRGFQDRSKEGKAEDGEVILVSQVVAAVAALHERSLLEQEIKTLQSARVLPTCQRVAEHDYISKRADEERRKRPNYITIIEHDGLLRRRPSNQETSNKAKTREELLAEERDYKRRRMSYRGKKSKRTPIEVMRDVIDEYMEEINEAGGIGCFEKGSKEEGMPSKPISPSVVSVNYDGLKRIDSFGAKSDPDFYHEISHYHHNSKFKTSKDDSLDKYEQQPHNHAHHEEQEHKRSTSQYRHSRKLSARSPERRRNDRWSSEQSVSKRERNDSKVYQSKHRDKRSSRNSSPSSYKSYHAFSVSDDDLMEEEEDPGLPGDDRNSQNFYRKRSDFKAPTNFEDRYDPMEPEDKHQHDLCDH